MKVTAIYVGRRSYEVTVKNGGKTIKKRFKEPFFKDPKKYAIKVKQLTEEFYEENVKITQNDLSSTLKAAANKAEREFPNLLV